MAVLISVVSPVYKNQNSIEEFVFLVSKVVCTITEDFEIILVNDGSPDNSWEVISNLAMTNKKVKAICLSRNFGQHPAIYCGLAHAKGEAVIVMDCDLQENPSYINQLYQKYQEGNDIVYTYKKNRKFALWKNFAVLIFSKIYNYLINNKLLTTSKSVGSFSLISRKVVESFLKFNDCQFHYLIVLRWLGFKSTFVEIEHRKRKHGKSPYNFKRLFEHALVAIVFQSDKLLRLNIYLGFFISLFSFLAGLAVIIRYFVHGFAPGWASLTVLILFSLGIILFSMGILGLYIGKMFEQTKQRPLYIIEKKLNIS